MKIVFLTHYYAPEVNAPASRTSEHCRVWAREGHSVTVVTCAPNHPAGKVYPGYRNRLFQRETIEGVEVIRLWTFLAANEGFARRIANYVSYLLAVLVALPWLPRADVVISTSPQFFCGLAGWPYRLFKGGKWILEIRDLWPESIVTVGAMKKGAVIRALEALERFAYRKADRIVSVTDSFVKHIADRCGDAGKITVIKNGVDLKLFSEPDAGVAAAFKAEHGAAGKFVAAYVGTHGLAHGLDTVLDAASILRDDQRIMFLLVGDGAQRAELEAKRAALGLTNVKLLGQLPKSSMPAVWAATDASLILLVRNPLFRTVLPSKMFEAMAMRRPIVLGVEGEARELLDAAGAGIAITPQDAGELAQAVTRLLDEPIAARELGDSGRAFVEQHFNRDSLAARYLDEMALALGHAGASEDALGTTRAV